MPIDYNGRPEFSKKRKLTDITNLEHFEDILVDKAPANERAQAADELFKDVAKTYLKGNVVLDSLAKMDPAQFIPIEENADSVRASASRLDRDESRDGTIISYNLYQKAINTIMVKKWAIRGKVLNVSVPASVEGQSKDISTTTSGSGGLIEEFLAQNGIAATIIGMLTMSPFQSLIFQTLTVEEGAKGVQTAQIPIGIALFLELGIKAERIIEMLKTSKVSTPLVELQVQDLAKSPEKRQAALAEAGIDYDSYLANMSFKDSKAIIEYVNDYYKRYGGLDRPNGHLTIDHWIAYFQVAQSQQTLKGCLNTAPVYSPKFREYKRNSDVGSTTSPIDIDQSENTDIFVGIASATRAAKESANTLYDDVVDAFVYQLTDRDLCCLVQIMGEIGNPKLLETIANLLRILATDLGGEIVRISNLVSAFIGNFLQDALFEIVANFNEFYQKIVRKITKAFTIKFDNLEACGGMLSIGWSIMHSIRVLFNEAEAFMKELSTIIGNYGQAKSGSWHIAADRRFLITTAHMLEVLAARLDLANQCAKTDVKVQTIESVTNIDNVDDQAIFSIINSMPPTLKISQDNINKHFKNTTPRTSPNLKFDYGINSLQNNERDTTKCGDNSLAIEQLKEIARQISESLAE